MMSIQGMMNTALSGMQAQTTRLNVAANNIANSQTPGYNRLGAQTVSTPESGNVRTVVSGESPAIGNGNDVNLESEMLDVIRAGIDFKANAFVFETGADLWDVLKTMKRD